MIEIETKFEEENNFLVNLQYQIIRKYYRFYKKIPEYHDKLDNLNFKLKLKESIQKIRRKFEMTQKRKNYAAVVSEFEYLLKNH
ncbi:MAG: hypothetical protein ACFFDO_00475 [Candidatus Thorarchaeota archaeon]